MHLIKRNGQSGWIKDEELIFTILCCGIAATLIFWPLLNSICCMVLFVYWAIFSRKHFSAKTKKSRWIILFASLFFISVIGVLNSENLKEAMLQLQKKSALLIFPIILGTTSVIAAVVFRRIFMVFAWSTFIGCLLGIVNGIRVYFTTGAVDHLYGYKLIVLKDMSPFMLGLCCTLSFLFLVDDIMKQRTNASALNRLNILLALFFFLFLFLLGNRNLLAGMSVIFVFYCFRLIADTFKRLLLIAALGVLFVVAVTFNPYFRLQWKDLVDFSSQNTIQLDNDRTLGRAWGGKTIRLSIWKCSLDILKENWVSGVGTGDVQDALQRAYENRKFYFASRYNSYNAHNQYIQVTVAHGIWGLLLFLCCIFLPLLKCFKKKDDRLYPLFLLCFALLCITESMLELNKGIIWYSFFNSIFMFRKV